MPPSIQEITPVAHPLRMECYHCQHESFTNSGPGRHLPSRTSFRAALAGRCDLPYRRILAIFIMISFFICQVEAFARSLAFSEVLHITVSLFMLTFYFSVNQK